MNTTIEKNVENSTAHALDLPLILQLLADEIGTTPERKRLLLGQLNTPKIRVSFPYKRNI